MPSRRSISTSKSRKLRPSSSATCLPTVDFPAPGNPTRIACGRRGSAADTGFEVRNVAVIVPPRFGERVAAELFEECLGHHERGHRFGNHTHRRDGGHVAALGNGGGGLARQD